MKERFSEVQPQSLRIKSLKIFFLSTCLAFSIFSVNLSIGNFEPLSELSSTLNEQIYVYYLTLTTLRTILILGLIIAVTRLCAMIFEVTICDLKFCTLLFFFFSFPVQ